MMLDVDFTELREGFIDYLPIGLVIGGIFLFELLLTVGFWVINPGVAKSITAAIPTNVSNTEALGLVLYTKYVHYFQIAGMVLLVAMIGAIVLTLRHKASVKRQDINVQNARTPELAMSVRKVGRGAGPAGRGRGGVGAMTIGLGTLPLDRCDPVHARYSRHLPEPQEHHRHPDVDRTDPARGQHQPGGVFDLPSATSSARSSRCWC